jgi:hypothetical protein
MRAAILNADGIVINTVIVDSLGDIMGSVACPDHIGIGHHIDEPVPVVPEEAPAPQTRCTPLQFIEKFTDSEQLAIVTAAMSSPALRLWYDKLMASQEVVFSDPRLSSGMEALATVGLISETRSEEILPLSLRSTGMQAV